MAEFINTGMIVNAIVQLDGFEIHPVTQQPYLYFLDKTIYEFTLNKKHPLAFIDFDGTWYQTDQHFFTDQGTLPRLAQLCIAKDRFLGFYLHDSCYRFGGLWASFNQGKEWHFVQFTRKQADDLLYDMILSDPVPGIKPTAYAIWLAVRCWGWIAWGKGDERKHQPKGKIDPTKLPLKFA